MELPDTNSYGLLHFGEGNVVAVTGVNSGIVKERKRGDNRVASVSAGQNLVGRLGRALDDGDPHRQKNNIRDARTHRLIFAGPRSEVAPQRRVPLRGPVLLALTR